AIVALSVFGAMVIALTLICYGSIAHRFYGIRVGDRLWGATFVQRPDGSAVQSNGRNWRFARAIDGPYVGKLVDLSGLSNLGFHGFETPGEGYSPNPFMLE